MWPVDAELALASPSVEAVCANAHSTDEVEVPDPHPLPTTPANVGQAVSSLGSVDTTRWEDEREEEWSEDERVGEWAQAEEQPAEQAEEQPAEQAVEHRPAREPSPTFDDLTVWRCTGGCTQYSRRRASWSLGSNPASAAG